MRHLHLIKYVNISYTINFVNNVHNLFYLMSREDTTPYDRAPSNFDICLVKFVQI